MMNYPTLNNKFIKISQKSTITVCFALSLTSCNTLSTHDGHNQSALEHSTIERPTKEQPLEIQIEQDIRQAITATEGEDPTIVKVDHDLPEIDLWQRIRNNFALQKEWLTSPPTSNIQPINSITEQSNNKNFARIKKYIERYQRLPKDIFNQTDQSSVYLHYIVEAIEKNNMPSEIALLPFVESRFDPFAYSRSRASGLWQFIPITGKRFKLDKNWWYDERRDVAESTEAAIK